MKRTVKHLSTTAALMLAALAACGGAVADVERQSLASIRAAVIAFVTAQREAGEELEVDAGPLDPRLRLVRCDVPLEAFWAPGSGRVGQASVGVRCAGGKPWKLYVPTRVSILRQVAVASRPLVRGQRIGPGDLRLEKRDLARLRGAAVTDPEQVRGYVLARSLAAGRPLVSRLLQRPRLVQRGRKVQLDVVAAGINVRMAGIALEDGSLGDTVRVRNPASARTVEAVVVGPGQARLGG